VAYIVQAGSSQSGAYDQKANYLCAKHLFERYIEVSSLLLKEEEINHNNDKFSNVSVVYVLSSFNSSLSCLFAVLLLTNSYILTHTQSILL